MFINQLFPTCVLVDENKELATAMLPLCDKYTSTTQSNLLHTANFPSTLADHNAIPQVNREPLVVEFMRSIALTHVKKLAESCNIPYESIQLRPFGFFSSMKKHAYLRRHMHRDCTFSGTFYLDVDEDVPPLVFYDPRPISFATDTSPHTLSITPKTGMILLWNAWLEHEIPQMLHDKTRKVFSFNI